MTLKIQINCLNITISISGMFDIRNLNSLQFLRKRQWSFLATDPFEQREQEMSDFSDFWVFIYIFKFEDGLFKIFNWHLFNPWYFSDCLSLKLKILVKSVDNVKSLFNLELNLNELVGIDKSWNIIPYFFFDFSNCTLWTCFIFFNFSFWKSKHLFSEGSDHYYCFEIFRQQNSSKSRDFEFIVFKSVIVMIAVLGKLFENRSILKH